MKENKLEIILEDIYLKDNKQFIYDESLMDLVKGIKNIFTKKTNTSDKKTFMNLDQEIQKNENLQNQIDEIENAKDSQKITKLNQIFSNLGFERKITSNEIESIKTKIMPLYDNKNYLSIIKLLYTVAQNFVSNKEKLFENSVFYNQEELETIYSFFEASMPTSSSFLDKNKKVLAFIFFILLTIIGIGGALSIMKKTPSAPSKPNKPKTELVQKKDPIKEQLSKENFQRSEFNRVLKEKLSGPDAEKYKDIEQKFNDFIENNSGTMKKLIKNNNLEGDFSAHIYKVLDEGKNVDYQDKKAFDKIVKEADEFAMYANSKHMTKELTTKYLIWSVQK